jgi:hypothetical protein
MGGGTRKETGPMQRENIRGIIRGDFISGVRGKGVVRNKKAVRK